MKNQQLPIKPNNSRYTDGQWQAIYESGNNILVSASAGSGKTTVLVQRVIEKIKAGANVDELLIVTYTESAAKEMKSRIQLAVQQAITDESDQADKHHLVRQISRLSQASISTMHAFCLQVIRRYYYLIDLDPVFRLLTDETEMLLLKEDVWEAVREKLYGEENSLFKELTSAYSNDRSDDGLTELIFSLYEFSRANPNPELWLEHLTDLYQVKGNDLTNGRLYHELLKPQIIEILTSLTEISETAQQMGKGETDLKDQAELIAFEAAHIKEFLRLIQDDLYDKAYQHAQSLTFARWKSVKKKADDAVKESGKTIKELRDQYKSRYTELVSSYFDVSPERQLEIMMQAVPLVEEMARVTKIFSHGFQLEKEQRNLLDFNDLEHLTLQILAGYESGEWKPTEASHHYREKFKEVMVDEYQDINQLQENILYWLTQDSSENGNFFMVGDVKQSIYSFRLADPSLFLGKYEKYANGNGGERIILAENFRSRKDVLHFINLIFVQLMDPSVGQMHYDQAAELIPGFPLFPESDLHRTEILIYEKGQQQEENEDEGESLDWAMRIEDKTEGELLMTGHKIKQLISEKFPIFDKKTKRTRSISYKDIVLLTPTKKNNLVLMEMFKRMGIPLQVNDTQNYFQTTEITIMMSLLKIIDNPYQDIPLAAVLRSPIVGLDENELASIRISKKTGDYYEALLHFYNKYPGEDKASRFDSVLYNKIDLFLKHLNKWRQEARREELVKLIWSIYKDTGFLDYVGGMSSGRQRKANLHALYERAASYEKTSFKGLFQFVRFIEKMQEKDKDLAEPTAISIDDDAVRVMTIHASKGLEFPVVFVLDLTKRFNLQDIRKNYLFNEDYGVGTGYKDLEQRIQYHSLPEIALKAEKKNKLLSEEMRKLYVAMTRAEEKLFLVGSYKDEEAAWKEWGIVASHDQTVLPADIRFTANSLMKWIGLSLIRHSDSKNAFISSTAHNAEILHHLADFSVHFYNESAIQENSDSIQLEEDKTWFEKLEEETGGKAADDKTTKAIRSTIASLEYAYQYETATHTTSYQSVSEIKRLFEEPDDGQMVKIDINQPRNRNRYVEDRLPRPKFMAGLTAPTTTEIGTATHLLMQSIDLSSAPTKESLQRLLHELIKRGVLLEETAEKIQVSTILRFFDSKLGKTLVDDHEYVRREVPFSLLLKAEQLFSDMGSPSEDKILVHGIIDGYLDYPEKAVLFDYKTDHLERFGVEAGQKMLDKYKGQINLYRSALESILDKPVSEAYLVLLSNGEIVPANATRSDQNTKG